MMKRLCEALWIEAVEALVEFREFRRPRGDQPLVVVMLALDRIQRCPGRMVVGERGEGGGRAQFEHLADLGQFQREFAGEPLETPAAVRPLLDQPETPEADQELANAGDADAGLARQFRFGHQRARLDLVRQAAVA